MQWHPQGMQVAIRKLSVKIAFAREKVAGNPYLSILTLSSLTLAILIVYFGLSFLQPLVVITLSVVAAIYLLLACECFFLLIRRVGARLRAVKPPRWLMEWGPVHSVVGLLGTYRHVAIPVKRAASRFLTIVVQLGFILLVVGVLYSMVQIFATNALGYLVGLLAFVVLLGAYLLLRIIGAVFRFLDPWLTDESVLFILLLFLLPPLLLAVVQVDPSIASYVCAIWALAVGMVGMRLKDSSWIKQLAPNLLAIAIGIFIIEEIQHVRIERQEVDSLVRQLGSRSNDFALEAARLLKERNLLQQDGLPLFSIPGANLANADLADAKLENHNLNGVNLRGAVLRRADLSGADLRNANLSGAVLSNANLDWANLANADLGGARLDNASLDKANLENANLTYSYYDDSTIWPVGIDYVRAGAVHLESTPLRPYTPTIPAKPLGQPLPAAIYVPPALTQPTITSLTSTLDSTDSSLMLCHPVTDSALSELAPATQTSVLTVTGR